MINKTIGKYKIIKEIATGGMATVYLAVHTVTEEKVAIKIMHPHLVRISSQVVSRFLQEAKNAAKLKHPNIIRTYDAGEEEGQYYLVMDYVDGITLKELIKQKGTLDIKLTIEIINKIADALQTIHSQGLIHRDVKSTNIMIERNANPILMDFGIAKSADGTRLTQTGTTMGTPGYMSPEQIEGKEVDYRTDIYSLGIVAYEMLTGKVPFEADTITGVMYKTVHQEPEFPKDIEIPSYLEGIIQNALAKDISQRYQSIATLASDLKSKITPEPTVNKRIEPTVLASPSRPQKSKYITIGIPAGVGLLLLTIMIFALSSLLTKPERKELKSSPPPVVAQKSVRVEPDVIGQDVKNPALFSKADEEEKIRRVLNRWIETIEEGNISEHMSYYADLVGTYFTKHNLTNSRIYRDKVNAFSKYDTFDMDIRDINIDVVSEDFAIAIFDKRWDARGPGRKFAGDERQRLKLRKYGDNWKIFSEEELEVYWVER